MWSFLEYGPATAVVDFTSDFAVVFMGLMLAVVLPGAMIAWSAIRQAREQERQDAAPPLPHTADQRDAA
jgi:hypothetical protein